jgi:hypothetical protein
VGISRLACNALYKRNPCVAYSLDIFRMQPPGKLSVKNYFQIFKFSDRAAPKPMDFHVSWKKTIISDFFTYNERPRSPKQVISLVKDVCKQYLTATTCVFFYIMDEKL